MIHYKGKLAQNLQSIFIHQRGYNKINLTYFKDSMLFLPLPAAVQVRLLEEQNHLYLHFIQHCSLSGLLAKAAELFWSLLRHQNYLTLLHTDFRDIMHLLNF